MKDESSESQRERLLWVVSAALFLIFFQIYMVAPLIPRLSEAFGVSGRTVGLLIPAYMIPAGISTLAYALLSDRLGRGRLMLASLLAFVVLTALTATAQSASQMILWRVLTGLGGGVVPLALALPGDLYPEGQRGRPLGWLFGALAGGAAFGATLGAILAPFVGWRMLFIGVAILAAIVLGLLLPSGSLLGARTAERLPSPLQALAGYGSLLATVRGRQTYAYVLWNGLFHSAVYTWLGLYFARRHDLGSVGIGLAMLGYGIPALALGPVIGCAADRWGRRWLLPAGLGIGAAAAAVLMAKLPLAIAILALAALSLGYVMSQPLLTGIVTALDEARREQAMGLNIFTLFIGCGIGSFLFGEALPLGFSAALALFGAAHLVAALAAILLFRSESTGASRESDSVVPTPAAVPRSVQLAEPGLPD